MGVEEYLLERKRRRPSLFLRTFVHNQPVVAPMHSEEAGYCWGVERVGPRRRPTTTIFWERASLPRRTCRRDDESGLRVSSDDDLQVSMPIVIIQSLLSSGW